MQFSYFYGGIDSHFRLIDNLVAWSVEFITLNHRQCDFILQSKLRQLEIINRDFKKAGIAMRALHAPFGFEDNLSDENEERRLKTLHIHKEIIRRLPSLGIGILHIHPSLGSAFEDRNAPREIIFTQLLKSLKELVSVAGDFDVRLGLENTPASLGSPEELLSIMEVFNSRSLGVCYDTGHAHISSGVIHGMNILGKHIFDFHIHDNNAVQDNHLQPPYGTIDWKSFIEKVAEIGFTGPLTIESLSWGNAGLERMAREVEAFFSGRIVHWEDGDKRGIVSCSDCRHIFILTPTGPSCCCKK